LPTNCRAHRQRTQGYIKALENEILRLRSQAYTLGQENADLKNQVTALTQGFMSNSMPLVHGLANLGTKNTYESSSFNRGGGHEESEPNVMIDLTQLDNIEAERWCSTQAAEEEPSPYEPLTAVPPAFNVQLEQPGVHHAPLDTQAGVDFVLE
jgi:hypothetical protein